MPQPRSALSLISGSGPASRLMRSQTLPQLIFKSKNTLLLITFRFVRMMYFRQLCVSGNGFFTSYWLFGNEQYYCVRSNVLMCGADISERESPGLELLLARLCAVLPELTYRSLRDILVSLTLLHAAAAHHQQLATLDCLLDQELADKMTARLDLSATQGGGGYGTAVAFGPLVQRVPDPVHFGADPDPCIRPYLLTNGSGSDYFLQ
jgi:hypothetical protein